MHRVMLDEAGTVGVTEVQYYDGLGRPTEAVSNANGNGTNFTYQLQEYDAKGRASKSWLAVAGSSSPDYMDVSSLQSAALGRDGVPYNETVYDTKGQVVLSRTKNVRGGIDDTFTKYSFTGKPVKKLVNHRSVAQLKHTEEYAYTYDGVDRIKKVMHTVDGGNPVKIAEYMYNNQGQISQKRTAGYNRTYSYNIRNWLTHIGGGDPFQLTLRYETPNPNVAPQYGGNITSMEWLSDGDNERSYDFEYDELSRLTWAQYGSYYDNEDFSEEYSYDANGNVTMLFRNGFYNGANGVDALYYSYNGNQIKSVDDEVDDLFVSGVFHFEDGADETTEFQYDKNGNMTQDLNRGFLSIDYNALNLPQAIHYNDYSSISNTYTAEGEKQFRLTLINNNAWPAPIGNLTPPNMTAYVTQYCGNMVYSSQGNQSESERMLIDGGYVTFENSTPKYHFYVQDHLGNNRAVVSQTGVVEQQAQYYPSGAIMTSISEGISLQPYLYSGKELDRMHALDWYDFGARHYDAALLRWHSMDPLCENHYELSPYAFCANNFVNAVDYNGMDTINISWSQEKWVISDPIIAKGDDVFNVTDAFGNLSSYTFNNNGEGKNVNMLNIETTDSYNMGVYHISGSTESGGTGYYVTPGGEASNKLNSNARIEDGVYPLLSPTEGAQWKQFGVGGGVSKRGIRIHYGMGEGMNLMRWTKGCFLLSSDYNYHLNMPSYSGTESKATVKAFDMILGVPASSYGAYQAKTGTGISTRYGIIESYSLRHTLTLQSR